MTADGQPPRAVWRAAIGLLVVCEAVALAVWLRDASVHIMSWPASGPMRLALTPPVWQLAVASGAGLILAGLIWMMGQRVVRASAPLALLWTWVVPFLPWLPDRAPLLLVLAGPLRWVIAGIAVWLMAARLVSLPSADAVARSVGRRAIFVISLVIFVVLGLRSVARVGLGGDEPHYLIITESLLRDGDLKIENNHQQRDYRSFAGGELRPDYMQRGKDGEIYSIHAPGLSVLVLPAYLVAGYRGAVAFMALLAALTALAVFDLAEELTGRGVALLTWLATCLTVPFVPHSWLLFPEMPGALLVAWSALWVWRREDSPVKAWLWRGVALATLPWLHTKFVVLLVVFGPALALKIWRRPKALAALSIPVAISGALWLYSFYAIYGVFDPEAPYGVYSRVNVITRYIPHGLIGILLDQKFGFLFYSPIYFAAIAGAWLLARRPPSRYLALVLLAVVAVFMGSTARLYMFWGGNSAPARFLVPIVPCLAPMVAVAIAHARGSFSRAVIGLWMAIGLALAIVGAVWPERLMLFSDPHGRARILEALQASSPLALVVPTFTEPSWQDELPRLLPWLTAGFVGLGGGFAASRLGRASAWTVAAIVSAIFLAAGGVLTAHPALQIREDTERRSDNDVLWRLDGSRMRTFDYSTWTRTTPDQLIALETSSMAGGVQKGVGYTAGPFALPAGVYDAVVWFSGAATREGSVVVESPPHATFGTLSGPLTNPTTVRFELPVGVRRLRIRVPDDGTATAVTSVQVVPRQVVAPSERNAGVAREVESIPERPGAFIAYLDEHAFPEGGVFWTRDTEETHVMIAPGGRRRLVLTLSTGPMTGAVRVRVAGDERTVTVLPGSAQQVAFDLDAAARAVPLVVASSVMFRPSEHDPKSADMRRLGCQVRVDVE